MKGFWKDPAAMKWAVCEGPDRLASPLGGSVVTLAHLQQHLSLFK